MQSCAAALERLCSVEAGVSAHYLISEQGEVAALVPEERRAWHAGAGVWAGQGDVNSRSIGIELANPGTAPFAAAQMRALEDLLAGILARWSIPPEGVIAHSDMAPSRKSDPGPRFDWRRLALSGLSVWPEARAGQGDAPALDEDAAAFAAALAVFGHDPELTPDLRLKAFRLRFRPQARGPLDATDLALAQDLARRWPAAVTPAAEPVSVVGNS